MISTEQPTNTNTTIKTKTKFNSKQTNKFMLYLER